MNQPSHLAGCQVQKNRVVTTSSYHLCTDVWVEELCWERISMKRLVHLASRMPILPQVFSEQRQVGVCSLVMFSPTFLD